MSSFCGFWSTTACWTVRSCPALASGWNWRPKRQRAYVRLRPLDTDTDYMLDTFAEAARLPGLAGLFDPAHNPLFRLPLSGDGAIELLKFFRAPVLDTGALVHDFSDPEWDTRFLGDLYQDLSDDARARFALLQTPEFVEE